MIRHRHHRINHKGGQLQFGPDGLLYMGFGDGAGSGDRNAQNRRWLLGKLLRIALRPGGGYSIPRGNPFVRRPGRDEIYAYGLRNPWRFSFDRRTGDTETRASRGSGAPRLGSRRAVDDRPLGVRVRGLVSFGEDALGRVYAVSLRGPVYRLTRL